jgi:hypothetical protein
LLNTFYLGIQESTRKIKMLKMNCIAFKERSDSIVSKHSVHSRRGSTESFTQSITPKRFPSTKNAFNFQKPLSPQNANSKKITPFPSLSKHPHPKLSILDPKQVKVSHQHSIMEVDEEK